MNSFLTIKTTRSFIKKLKLVNNERSPCDQNFELVNSELHLRSTNDKRYINHIVDSIDEKEIEIKEVASNKDLV